MVDVPAGPFFRGSADGVGLEDEHPRRTIELSAFAIDKTEVTQADYAKCVTAGTCSAITCSRNAAQGDTKPVVCATWQQAKTFCGWVGKRLPTEAEWEKAARGTDGRLYPWGNDAPTCDHARYYGCGKGEPDDVGSHPKGASPYGALDMAGNVWEWVEDWHDDGYYASCPAKDPPGPATGTTKVVRGGAFKYGKDELLTAERTFDKPTVTYEHVGFRCAKSR